MVAIVVGAAVVVIQIVEDAFERSVRALAAPRRFAACTATALLFPGTFVVGHTVRGTCLDDAVELAIRNRAARLILVPAS